MSASSPAEAGDQDISGIEEGTKDKQAEMQASDVLEGRTRTLTLKGFEYQLPIKMIMYQEALTKLRDCINRVDMLWTDANDVVARCALQNVLEENRQMLEGARSGYTPFVSVTEL